MAREMVRAHVVMPKDVLTEVDELVGPRRRSHYVTDAVEERLRRDRLLRAIDEMAGSLADVDIPGWETPESTSEWIRNLRREWDTRVAEPPGPTDR